MPEPNTSLPMMDRSVSFSDAVGLSRLASSARPKKAVPRMMAIDISVRAALRLWGFWKAGTPSAMASTPVSATAPEAKARSRIMALMPVRAAPPVSSSMAAWFVGRRARSPV